MFLPTCPELNDEKLSDVKTISPESAKPVRILSVAFLLTLLFKNYNHSYPQLHILRKLLTLEERLLRYRYTICNTYTGCSILVYSHYKMG